MRLFISYAHKDTKRVEELIDLLKIDNHQVWFDYELRPGQNWKAELGREIGDCDAFVYVLSPESVKSEWCRWEFATAVRVGKPVIPVLLEKKTKLPRAIRSIQYADFTQGTKGEAIALLLNGLDKLKIPLKNAPAVPANPQGEPPQARQSPPTEPLQLGQLGQNVRVGDVNNGTVTVTVNGDPSGGGEKQRDWTPSVIITVILTVVGVIVAIFAVFPEDQRNHLWYIVGLVPASITPTGIPEPTPTPTASLTPSITPFPTHTPLPTATPLEGPTAAPGEVRVLIFQFMGDDDKNNFQLDTQDEIRSASQKIQGANITTTRIKYIPDDEQNALSISNPINIYQATMAIYGRITNQVVTTKYLIEPRSAKLDTITNPILRVKRHEVMDFETVLSGGAGVNYMVGFTTGQLYYLSGDLSAALGAFASALEDDVLSDANDNSLCKQGQNAQLTDDLRVDILYIYRGNTYLENNQLQKAIEQFTCAIHAKPDNALGYYNRANAYHDLPDPDYAKAEADYAAALELQQDDHNLSQLKNRADTLNNLAGTLLDQQKFDDALRNYNLALGIERDLEDLPGEARILNNIGRLYHDWGLQCSTANRTPSCADFDQIRNSDEAFEKASSFYNQALDKLQGDADLVGKGVALNNLAQLEEQQGDFDNAIEHYKGAVDIQTIIKDDLGTGRILFNIGQSYFSQGDYDNALDYYKQALNKQPQLIDPVGRGTTLYMMGRVDVAKEDYKSAIDNLENSIGYLTNIDYLDNSGKEILSEVYYILGSAYASNNDLHHANGIYWAWIQKCRSDEGNAGTLEVEKSLSLNMHEGQFYRLSFEGQANQTVHIEANAGGPVDPFILLLDLQGKPLTYNDDISENDHNSRIDDYLLPATGTYTLVVTHAFSGSNGNINISISLN